jgi:hypothetical protein
MHCRLQRADYSSANALSWTTICGCEARYMRLHFKSMLDGRETHSTVRNCILCAAWRWTNIWSSHGTYLLTHPWMLARHSARMCYFCCNAVGRCQQRRSLNAHRKFLTAKGPAVYTWLGRRHSWVVERFLQIRSLDRYRQSHACSFCFPIWSGTNSAIHACAHVVPVVCECVCKEPKIVPLRRSGIFYKSSR